MVNDLYTVVSGVYARIGSAQITELTSGDIASLANDNLITVENMGGIDIDSGDIPNKYMPLINNLTSAFVQSRLLGIDIDVDIGIGTIRLGYSNMRQAEATMLDFFLARANESIKTAGIGRQYPHGFTIKID